MATLNITYQGRSGSVHVGDNLSLLDAQRIGLEVLRTGGITGMAKLPHLQDNALQHFVLDSHHEGGHTTYYLRPKVPFGRV